MAEDSERRWKWRRRDPAARTWWRNLMFLTGRDLIFRWTMAPLLGGIEVFGREKVPAEGGAVIAPNHTSHFDPPYVGVAVPRPLYFMAKRELFEVPIFGWIIYSVYAYPVERGTADRYAIRKAIDLVRDGEVLLIFPEGTRSPDGVIREGGLGPAMVAGRAGAPIIPCAISGTLDILPSGSKRPHRSHTLIGFGDPVYVEPGPDGRLSREALQDATRRMMDSLRTLHAELEERRKSRR